MSKWPCRCPLLDFKVWHYLNFATELREQDRWDLAAGGWGIPLGRSAPQVVLNTWHDTTGTWTYEELAHTTDVYLNTYFPCQNYGSCPSQTTRSHVTSCFGFQTPYLLRFQSASKELQWPYTHRRSNSEPSEVANPMEKHLLWRSLVQRKTRNCDVPFHPRQPYCNPVLQSRMLWGYTAVFIALKLSWLLLKPAGGSRPPGSNLPCSLRKKDAFYSGWSVEFQSKVAFSVPGLTNLLASPEL